MENSLALIQFSYFFNFYVDGLVEDFCLTSNFNIHLSLWKKCIEYAPHFLLLFLILSAETIAGDHDLSDH